MNSDRESCSVVSDSLRLHRLYSPWNSPGQNTGVGNLSLLQGIFPTQGSNPGPPHCRWILYQLSHQVNELLDQISEMNKEPLISVSPVLSPPPPSLSALFSPPYQLQTPEGYFNCKVNIFCQEVVKS